ncbi:MAG: TonB-dependent receptor [Rhodocyclaceae bacterium]|nr:TonB-dependent receptor [Rhodocyclaceae bacterium]
MTTHGACSVHALCSCLTLFGLIATPVLAQTSDEEDLALAYGDKSFVMIATGSKVPVQRAPAVTTVITAEDIAATGATDLDEVLATVPGFHVSRTPGVFAPHYTVRGITGSYNPHLLMLVNGIPMTTVFSGDRGNVWGGLPLENVARIEVIRGPGSAVYGADAFAGVVNIITKTASDIDGTEFGLRAGSFDTQDAWVLHGGQVGAFELNAYLRAGTTDGHRETVRADGQSGWDALFGTNASHAPGPIDARRKALDGEFGLAFEHWRLRLGLKKRHDVGSGLGVASALDPTGKNASERITADLTYDNPDFARDWALTAQASLLHYVEQSDLVLYPAGAFGGAFSDGMIGNPDKWERHVRAGASAIYSGFADHRIRLGAGVERKEIYKIRESKNFNPDFSPIGTGSRADVIDVSHTAPFLRPHSRRLHYAYVQDEWAFARDWTLTAGVRHDRYSDFGATTNPRVALAWEAAYNMTARLMAGTAFRAPSFTELYNLNNPVVIGNPDLDPERIRTLELALSWQPTSRLQLGANAFRYRMRDIIQLVNTVYANAGSQTGSGLELEAQWDATPTVRLAAHYAWQRSIDDETDRDAGLSPRHQLYLRGDWRFTPGWLASAQVKRVADRRRQAGDARSKIGDYHTADLSIRTERSTARRWDLALSVRNLFDARAYEPSTFSTPFVAIPHDIPMPGRTIYLQASIRL